MVFHISTLRRIIYFRTEITADLKISHILASANVNPLGLNFFFLCPLIIILDNFYLLTLNGNCIAYSYMVLDETCIINVYFEAQRVKINSFACVPIIFR